MNVDTKYYIYDLEVYPNIFTFCGKFKGSDEIQMFEVSDRINQTHELVTWLSYLRNLQAEMIGFNNIGYDYYLIHEVMTNPYTFDHNKAFQLSQTIIVSQGVGKTIERIRPHNRLIAQIDMMKVCHFDNNNKRTSLKALQFAMRSESLEDLPFKIRPLNDQEKNKLREYNVHDVTETEKFFLINEHLIDLRREYLNDGILKGDVLNFSDVKIGVEYLTARIGRNKCYSGSKPRHTFRERVVLNSIILPKIEYRTDMFNEVLSWFKLQTIYIQSKVRPKLEVSLGGLDFHFGVGGVHASTENNIYKSNETHQIIDIDVTGMYVSVAIANKFAPEHLGTAFVEAYAQIKLDRSRYAKGTSRNAVLKLAGNGAFGNFNNIYSCFYDPQCLLSVTINGQLQLLQLAEILSLIPDCELIQANTDGITVYINKKYEHLFKLWCDEWEKMVGLELEEVRYSRMWIRDVNNYIAETEDGKMKRKGAYWYPLTLKEYEGWWNKDYSNLASKMAAEKVMTHSWPVEIAIRLVTNPFDFMLRYKATGGSILYIGEEEQLKTVRYYVSLSGQPMKKVAPPRGDTTHYKRKPGITDDYFKQVMGEISQTCYEGPTNHIWDERIHTKNKKKYAYVTTNIKDGWKVRQCNVAKDFNWNDVDWTFYIEEAKKIIIGSK